MRRTMPISLIAAEVATLSLVVYLAIMLWLDIQLFLSGFLRMRDVIMCVLHLAWSVIALVGIPLRCRFAWRLACAASAFFGLLTFFGGVSFLLLASLGNSSLVSYAICFFCASFYLLVVYYLLSRPTSVTYFEREGEKGSELETEKRKPKRDQN